MKKNLLTTILATVGLTSIASAAGAQEGLRVEPPCWWTGMETPLTLMLHAPGLSGAGVSVASDGITVKAVHYAESPNYLFVDLEIADNLTPGEYTFTINYPDGRTGTFAYSIGKRPAREWASALPTWCTCSCRTVSPTGTRRTIPRP